MADRVQELEALATKMVGDGKRPNVFFVNQDGNIQGLFVVGDDKDLQEEVIRFANDLPGFVIVEDRFTGVYWENEASLRRQLGEEETEFKSKPLKTKLLR